MSGVHTDRAVYIAWMLWLVGMSESAIGAVVMKRRKQIAGIINRSPYANRSAMTDEERLSAIRDLLSIRVGEDGSTIDGGILDRIPMRLIPLRPNQKRLKGGKI